MASRSSSDKYFLANNPNGEVTDAQVVALKSLDAADLNVLDDLTLPMAAEADLVDALTGITMASSADTLTTSGTATVGELAIAVGVLGNKINDLMAKLRTAGILTS